MAAERFVEFESGLCVRMGVPQDMHALLRAGGKIKCIRDLWGSVSEFEEYKASEASTDGR